MLEICIVMILCQGLCCAALRCAAQHSHVPGDAPRKVPVDALGNAPRDVFGNAEGIDRGVQCQKLCSAVLKLDVTCRNDLRCAL
eukprot:6751764-Pyramimonas_sp.AAC.1